MIPIFRMFPIAVILVICASEASAQAPAGADFAQGAGAISLPGPALGLHQRAGVGPEIDSHQKSSSRRHS